MFAAWHNTCLTLIEEIQQEVANMHYLSHPLALPVISLIFGLIILVFPRFLNYIVAIYLLIIGIGGLIAYLR